MAKDFKKTTSIMTISFKKLISRLIYGLLLLFLFSGVPVVSAADMYFSPSSGTYGTDQTIAVGVYVSSADQSMNAVSGTISFPKDKMEVVSLSKAGSILSLWVQEPSYSNSAGTITFEGIVFNPGFTGSAGKIISVNFRVKAGGSATVNFSSGSVLANDGQGTNILKNLRSANLSLGNDVPEEPTEIPQRTLNISLAPQISSPTHPDTGKWYAKSDAKFAWSIDESTLEVRLLIDQTPRSTPTILYTPAVREREISSLEDGVWYFHVQLRDEGGWGETAHFKLQIDTTKPNFFDITEVKRNDPTEPRAKFIFDARDSLSGIDYYEIQIDGGSVEKWVNDGTNQYETIALDPGKHSLVVKAVDKAGNKLEGSDEFIIAALEPPVINEYPKELPVGETMIIRGTTDYINSEVQIWFQRESGEKTSQSTTSDGRGNFVLITEDKLKDGVYRMWGIVVDERGAESSPSEYEVFLVERPAFLRVGDWTIGLLVVLIPLIALLLLLAFMLWHGWHRYLKWRVKFDREADSVERVLRKGFNLMKISIQKQIKTLEDTETRRRLTGEEKVIIKELKKSLADTNKFVAKEIKKVRRDIK